VGAKTITSSQIISPNLAIGQRNMRAGKKSVYVLLKKYYVYVQPKITYEKMYINYSRGVALHRCQCPAFYSGGRGMRYQVWKVGNL